MQLDFANILRLGPNSQANIANFTHKYIQIQLRQGLANYSVFGESEAEPEIDTPNVAVHPAHQDGVFRIEVRPDGDTIIIVRKGEAQISTPQGIADVKARRDGHGARIRRRCAVQDRSAPERDDWDRWNSDRDRMIHSADAWRHTNQYYTGSEDLDANGRWENVPDYGQMWVPNEPDGLGSVPRRQLGLGALLRLDLGWLRAMGLGAVSLWPLDVVWRFVGMVAGTGVGRGLLSSVLGAGLCFVLRIRRRIWIRLRSWVGRMGWFWLAARLVPVTASFHGGADTAAGSVLWASTGLGGYGRFGGFAPLHGGTRFSNVAHINDPHIGRRRSRRWVREDSVLAELRRWRRLTRS